MEHIIYQIKDLPQNIYKQLYYLNLREIGYMRDILTKARKKQCKKTRIVVYQIEYEVLGWGLCSPSSVKGIYDVHIYIKKKYRENGLGKNILHVLCQYIKSIDKIPGFFPYNESTTLFFSENNSYGGVILD